jgi:hypothetical protein
MSGNGLDIVMQAASRRLRKDRAMLMCLLLVANKGGTNVLNGIVDIGSPVSMRAPAGIRKQ